VINAIRHHNPAHVRGLLINVLREIHLCQRWVDLLGGEHIVVALAIAHAVATLLEAKPAGRTTAIYARPAAEKVSAKRILIMVAIGAVVKLLEENVAAACEARAKAEPTPILAAVGRLGAAPNLAVSTVASFRQILDLPILAAAEALVEDVEGVIF